MFFFDSSPQVSPLVQATCDNTSEYCVKGVFDCKVVRVYDGDTVYAVLPFKETLYKFHCRLLGIDTHEMPCYKNANNDNGQKAFAARDRLVELLTNIDLPREKKEYLTKYSFFTDSCGNILPSFPDNVLQNIINEKNTLILSQGIELGPQDNFGRYLVNIKTKDDRNASRALIDEGYGKPFLV